MADYQSLEVMRGVLSHCVAALAEVVQEGGWQDEAVHATRWQPLFGKESVAGALAKLVAMHKSLMEQESQAAAMAGREGAELSSETLSEEEWALMRLCVERRGEG